MRYLPLQDTDRQAMLKTIGVSSIEELFARATGDQSMRQFTLPDHQDEQAVLTYFTEMAARNKSTSQLASFLGGGYYRYYLPAAVDYIIQRGEFMTAYTPYQPEIAQGTLQYLFEFQTQVSRITGMECANASLWDGATASAEAVIMARRINKRNRAVLSGNLHPHCIAVARTYCEQLGIEVVQTPTSVQDDHGIVLDDSISSLVMGYPNFFGKVQDFSTLAEQCAAHGVLLILVCMNPVPLGLLKTPGEMGADIVVGEGQALGTPLSFGGPGLGLLACRLQHVRQMPGRLVGQTVDAAGNRMYVLTLVAREQHIRRDKATSNICTNSGLCVLAFSAHLALLGAQGLRKLACADHARARMLYDRIQACAGVSVVNNNFYNEFVVKLPVDGEAFVHDALDAGLLAGVPLKRFYDDPEYINLVLVSVTQTTTEAHIETFVRYLQSVCQGV